MLLLVILFFFSSCNLFDNKEKKAIEIVQNAKMQFETDNVFQNLALGMAGLNQGALWKDFANMIAEKDANTKFEWTAKTTDDSDILLVAFTDSRGWGHRWEVALEQQTVKHVNQNEYLTRKYGLSRLDKDRNFEIIDIKIDTMKIEKERGLFSNNSSKKVVYTLEASMINKTGNTLTNADLSGTLKLIFKDKVIEGNNNYNSGFVDKVSKSKPWKPETVRKFLIKTKGIDLIYLDYIPEYALLEVNLEAEDPIGYSFDKNVEEYDIKEKWTILKNKN